jgi:hypothetical protein
MSDKPNSLLKFWSELKRRRVIKTIGMYAASAFILLEVVDIVTPALSLPVSPIDIYSLSDSQTRCSCAAVETNTYLA